MSFLRKCLGRPPNSSSNCHESGDKNEYNNKSVAPQCHTSFNEFPEHHHLRREPVNKYMVKMVNFIRELAIFCLIFMAYASITNNPSKLSTVPTAYPFFPKNSIVKDFYRGQIITAIEYARTSDLSFIMFYAPWDAECQGARKEFLKAADYMKERIIFTAVNCWQPGSECRNQYNRVYRWPVLIVYPSFGTGIQYNGPISAPHMISFLEKVQRPVKQIDETNFIQTNLNFGEASIVAEINTVPRSVEYSVYYTVALKYMESDYLGRVAFYVKPSKVSQHKISLYMWNQVGLLELTPDGWKVEKILQWILKMSESPSSWAAPTGSKSQLLSSFLQPGPALILFTPQNPLHRASDYYLMLQEIAQEYSNCNNWGLNFDMKWKRANYLLEYKRLKTTCQSKPSFSRPKKILSVTTSAPFLNSSTNMHQSMGGKTKVTQTESLGLDTRIPCVCRSQKMEECLDILPESSINAIAHMSPVDERIVQSSFGGSRSYTSSVWREDTDLKSSQNLRKTLQKERCKRFLSAEKLYPAVFAPNDSVNTEHIDISGLSCSDKNHSLNLVAMDSLRYYMFAERLGIDVSKHEHNSAVVIVDQKMETHYIMRAKITSRNLRIFIRKFSNDTLSRSRESNMNVFSKNSPSYTFNQSHYSGNYMINVEELTSRNFLQTVLQENKAVLVMYYSKQCSYCNGISYVFLTVARKLSFVENILFRRIDGEDNILPWEYTMEEFPTILFFPANMKEETRIFPSNIPITVANLLGFISSNVDRYTKLHLMYSVCLHSQVQKDKNLCLAKVRNETVSLIEKTLKDWRKSNIRHRQLILHNLKLLRQLQFLFSHSPEGHDVIESYFKKMRKHVSDDYNTTRNYSLKDEL